MLKSYSICYRKLEEGEDQYPNVRRYNFTEVNFILLFFNYLEFLGRQKILFETLQYLMSLTMLTDNKGITE